MKKFLLSLFLVLSIIGVALAAGPTVDESNRMIFKVADQESTASFDIYAIVWTEGAGASEDIAADDDVTLEDGAGTVIFVQRAAATGVGMTLSLDYPITVKGLKAEDLDGGILIIYGKRR